MNWNHMLTEIITDTAQLREYFPGVSQTELTQFAEVADLYPVAIPRYYLSLIDENDPNDPIRIMSIPSLAEMSASGEEDTSGEYSNTVIQGMQHKYPQTVLILSTNHCLMYCRYCFRKRMVGSDDHEVARQFDNIFAYIREHKEVTNVLVSGGDSFLNSNETIEKYLKNLTELSHLDFIRFGTKIPVVFPQRISEDPELLEILKRYSGRKQLRIMTQFNHPNELTPEAAAAIKCLQNCGMLVNNQSVLLKGVNDDPQVLGELMRGLTRLGITPYYVFQCRPVAGVKSLFQIPILKGWEIVEKAKMGQNGLGKGFRYVLSNPKGKIEVVGKQEDGTVILKYHQAKDPQNLGKVFSRTLSEEDCWII